MFTLLYQIKGHLIKNLLSNINNNKSKRFLKKIIFLSASVKITFKSLNVSLEALLPPQKKSWN
jgi:hypothetical protein